MLGASSFGGAGYGKVKAALGCFDERRLLLEPRWAESAGGVLAYRPEKQFEGGPACRAGVAQLVEHLICNQAVGGSNPFASSRFLGRSR